MEVLEGTNLREGPAYGSFKSGVALTFATRILTFVGGVGSSIVVARWLGPEGLGTLAVLNVTVALALQIGSAGLPSANTYFIARDRGTLGPVWANAITFALAAGALLAVLAVALNVLLAMDRIGPMNLLDSMAPVLALLNAIVALVIMRANLTTLVSLNTVAAIALSFSLLLAVSRLVARQKERRSGRPDFSLLKEMLVYGVKFYTSIMASVVIFRSDLLIVNHFRGAVEAGVYAVASQVSFLLLLLPGVMASMLFPRVASRQDPRGEFTVRVTRHASAVMFAICLAAAAASFGLPLVYGVRFADSTIQLLILLPGIYLVGIESVLVQHFTGTGLPVAIPVFWLITLAINVGLNLALVPAFGARAAAAISTLSYALILGLVLVYFCAKTGRRVGEIFLPRRYELLELFSLPRRGIF